MSALKTLGKHEIRRQLGQGAMGTVYEGWDPVIQRRVAIKTVLLPVAANDETIDEISRFRREAQAAGRLNHPNIVGVFDYGETDDLAYIVMEYVDGPTLKSLLDKRESFPLPRIAGIMRDVLAGLQFSHERGVVHRDIKPANLMLTASGQTKIADFGIARIENASITQAGTVLGTPAYMSPEQFMGQVADARSDIYSCGILLYQLLTGERPFEGTMASIMHKVLNLEAPLPSKISLTTPRQFDVVVRRAIARRPEDRYDSAAEFSTAIQAALVAPKAGPVASAFDTIDEATVVASPRAVLADQGRGALPGAAVPRSTSVVRPPTPSRGTSMGARGGAKPFPTASVPARSVPTGMTFGARALFASPAAIAGGLAGVAVLCGGIGWFLWSVPPPSLVPSPVPERQVEAVVSPSKPPAPERTAAPVTPVLTPAPEPSAPVTLPAAPPPTVALTPPVAPTPAPTPEPPTPASIAPAEVRPPLSPPLSPPVSPPVSPMPAPNAIPATPPATPALAVPLSPLERAREAARSVPCSALKVTAGSDGLDVSGMASGGAALSRLLTEAREAGRVADAVTRVGQFACAPISTVALSVRQSWESDPRPIVLTIDRPDPVSQGRMSIDVATSSPIVYVDLYQGGLVHHLLRPDSIGAERGPHAASVVAPGTGPGLLVAVGAATRLDLETRPESENAGPYLDILQSRLRDAATPPIVDLAMVTIRPAPPPPLPAPAPPAPVKVPSPEPAVPKVRPTVPSASNAPVPRPAALRSGRCSNILSRAQLGETLSNAEITALRTECRS